MEHLSQEMSQLRHLCCSQFSLVATVWPGSGWLTSGQVQGTLRVPVLTVQWSWFEALAQVSSYHFLFLTGLLAVGTSGKPPPHKCPFPHLTNIRQGALSAALRVHGQYSANVICWMNHLMCIFLVTMTNDQVTQAEFARSWVETGRQEWCCVPFPDPRSEGWEASRPCLLNSACGTSELSCKKFYHHDTAMCRNGPLQVSHPPSPRRCMCTWSCLGPIKPPSKSYLVTSVIPTGSRNITSQVLNRFLNHK